MRLPGGWWGALGRMLFTFIVMGCFMDTFGIVALTAPLHRAYVRSLGFDPLWPFVGLQLVGLIIVVIFLQIAI